MTHKPRLVTTLLPLGYDTLDSDRFSGSPSKSRSLQRFPTNVSFPSRHSSTHYFFPPTVPAKRKRVIDVGALTPVNIDLSRRSRSFEVFHSSPFRSPRSNTCARGSAITCEYVRPYPSLDPRGSRLWIVLARTDGQSRVSRANVLPRTNGASLIIP